MELRRDITCTFTGHRPERIPFPTSSPAFERLTRAMDAQIRAVYDLGYRIYLIGGARGIDLWFAERILAYRKTHPDVQLVACLPYRMQAKLWPQEWKQKHAEIMRQVDDLIYIQRNHSSCCLVRRNRRMVERSSLVVAVFDGTPQGGTAKTIEYAQTCRIPVEIIDLPSLV